MRGSSHLFVNLLLLVVTICPGRGTANGSCTNFTQQSGDYDYVALVQTRLERDAKTANLLAVARTSLPSELHTNQTSTADVTLESDLSSVALDCFVNSGGCHTGHCSGADGKCYQGPYKLLLDDFTIRNYRWRNEYMYASRFPFVSSDGLSHALQVGKNKTSLRSRFTLYEMPDGAIVMYNKAVPYFAAIIGRPDLHNNDDAVDAHFDLRLVNISRTQSLDASARALQLFEPPGGSGRNKQTKGAVLIGSYRAPRMYMYLPGTSQDVRLYPNDPGDGALWIFDPPLPKGFQLRRFEGQISKLKRPGFDLEKLVYVAPWMFIYAFLAFIVVLPRMLYASAERRDASNLMKAALAEKTENPPVTYQSTC